MNTIQISKNIFSNRCFILFIAFITFFVTSCRKKDDPLNNLPTPTNSVDTIKPHTILNGDLYLSGQQDNQAVYWKNGVLYKLQSEAASYTEDIIVHNDTTYVVGAHAEKACFWKNGKRFDLDNSSFGIAHSIVAKNDTIYIVGNIYDKVLKDHRPIIWKNAVPTYLGKSSGLAFDLCFVGNDIFVNGFEGKDACYWKNGISNTLKDGEISYSYHIYQSNGNIYISGFYKPTIKGNITKRGYWKNDIFTEMGIQDMVYRISSHNNNLYAIGWKNSHASFWINGQYSSLPSNMKSEARDVGFLGNDVYIGGFQFDNMKNHFRAGYWKNKEWHLLSNFNSTISALFCNEK